MDTSVIFLAEEQVSFLRLARPRRGLGTERFGREGGEKIYGLIIGIALIVVIRGKDGRCNTQQGRIRRLLLRLTGLMAPRNHGVAQ